MLPFGHTQYSWKLSEIKSNIPVGHTLYSWGSHGRKNACALKLKHRGLVLLESAKGKCVGEGAAASAMVASRLFGDHRPLFLSHVPTPLCSPAFEPVEIFSKNRVFFINLDRRPDRNSQFMSHMEYCGINRKVLQRCSAIDGRLIPAEDQPQHQRYNRAYWNSGALGCLRSHVCILQKALEMSLDHVLILEVSRKF